MAAARYTAIIVAAFAVTTALAPLTRWMANRWGVLDGPGARKAQQVPVPLLGGLAMAAGFSLTLAAASALTPAAGARAQLAATLALAIAVVLLGLLDDIRGLTPWVRLLAEAGVGAGAWAAGLGISLSGVSMIDAPLTVLWVLAITNAMNLLDNMDGLSSGVAVIAALWFLVIAGVNGQFLVAMMAAAVAGCALGFLRHNLPPARMYMGDAGALFLGFGLAVLGMKLRFAGPARVTFFVPILVLGVPLLDTAVVTLTRLAAGRSPFQGGRDHLSHRLVALGASAPSAVRALAASAFVFGWMALVMSRVDTGTAFALMGLVVAASVTVGFGFARVPLSAVDAASAATRDTTSRDTAVTLDAAVPASAKVTP